MATPDKTEAEKKAAEVTAKNTAEAKATLAALEASYEGTGWVVAEGKALTTNRGVVADGAAIGPLDFRYPEDFELRKSQGYIVAGGSKAK